MNDEKKKIDFYDLSTTLKITIVFVWVYVILFLIGFIKVLTE